MKRADLPRNINAALDHVGERFEAELEAWLCENKLAWPKLQRGEYGFSVAEALLVFVCQDPVRWSETFLVEPDTGDPYRFFGYQVESIRAWRQDTVHEDGAEVGKTREITVLVLWGSCTAMGGTIANPWMLVGAPQQTHLDEIILAVEEQVGVSSEALASGGFLRSFWTKPKRTPHTMHRFIAPNPFNPKRPSIARVYYRPAGVDGEAFRGVHVNALAFFDEGAKAKRKEHFSEFARALKPGCRQRVYSVPDGDRSSEFYRLCQSALPDLAEGQPGFRRFHWPKTLMPPPFWSAERDAEMIRRFGGRDTPGYKRNVLGEWGDAENPVFRYEDIKPNIVDVPEFRVLELLYEAGRGKLVVVVKRLRLIVSKGTGEKAGDEDWLIDTSLDLQPFVESDTARRAAMRDLIRTALPSAPRGLYWAGGDLGESNDPTAIYISAGVGKVLRDQVRVRAKGLPYYLQCELVHALDEHFHMQPFWGVDLGNAGTAVIKDLQTLDLYRDGEYATRMTGFHFAQSVPCIDEDGNALERDDDHGDAEALKAPAKHWATQMVVARLQRAGYEQAFDRPVIDAMTSHTAREGARHRIYAKKDDHEIDARRQQMLRKLYNDAALALDLFSVGAIPRRAA